jgi:hypothetical protein
MEFPADWTVLPKDSYDLAVPRIEGLLTMELHAELRPSGRILDSFRVSVGGSKLLTVEALLFDIIPLDSFKGWFIKADFRPEDIVIRRNLTTSAWIDGPALIMRREAPLFDDSGAGIPAAEFLRYLADLEDAPDSFAFRWATTAGEDGRMKLQLQSLPGSAVYITGKPLLKG